MKKAAKYVDGFVLPVPKNKLKHYLKIAKVASKVWLEHGALEYVETMADDVKPGKLTSFPQAVKLKKGEVVFLSWCTYKSRAHRDRVMKKVMADPRLTNEMVNASFDMKRMFWGGFKTAVNVSKS